MSDIQRTELSVQRERAVLVKVITDARTANMLDPLGEIRSLANAAGAIVLDGLTQKMRQVVKRTFIGSGKLDELAERVQANDANLIIFDNDLAPAQIREIEKKVECKVLDRSELILDIFASRAQTHEARLQVELAQLEYTAPRLRGMWTHLERIAGAGGATGAGNVGGIGTRGPGERQIEIDRRIVRSRISALKRDIEQIDRRKTRTIRSRSDCFTVSLVGYTNSGKSTLMKKVTCADVYIADKLFATLDTKTVRWEIDDCQTVLLSDTVGFVGDLPHRLVASFRATLEEAVHADLLLHVIDASNKAALYQVEAVHGVLHDLGCSDLPTVHVLNKIDAVEDESIVHVLERKLAQTVNISARDGEGIPELIKIVREAASAHQIHVTMRIPAGDGRLAAEIDRSTKVFARRYVDDSVEMDVIIDRRLLSRMAGQNPVMKVVANAEDGTGL